MTSKIFVTPLALLDIEDIVAYLAISNSDVALDFFDAVRVTFADLEIPILG
jgi:toxin ParE1/3/4